MWTLKAEPLHVTPTQKEWKVKVPKNFTPDYTRKKRQKKKTGMELQYGTHIPQVQKYAAIHRPSTRQNICEPLRVISVKHCSVLPDDGSHKIRNMSEWFLILCLLNFYTT